MKRVMQNERQEPSNPVANDGNHTDMGSGELATGQIEYPLVDLSEGKCFPVLILFLNLSPYCFTEPVSAKGTNEIPGVAGDSRNSSGLRSMARFVSDLDGKLF